MTIDEYGMASPDEEENIDFEAEYRAECTVNGRLRRKVNDLKSQLTEAQKNLDRLTQTLKFYADTRGLLPFVRVRENDPYLNPDGPPDAYGLSDELCIPAREAIAAMEAQNGRG